MDSDLVNAGFELVGALMLLENCRVLFRDKRVAGTSLATTAFFAGWGLWNLFYYPHLGQWISFSSGIVVLLANVTWLGLALKYRRK